MSPVRLRTEGWEMRCASCRGRGTTAWWPLTVEFWDPANMTRCRACQREDRRKVDRTARRVEYMKHYREAAKDALGLKQRLYYRTNRERLIAKNRAYYDANRDEINAKRRERYALNREEMATRRRELYHQRREAA